MQFRNMACLGGGLHCPTALQLDLCLFQTAQICVTILVGSMLAGDSEFGTGHEVTGHQLGRVESSLSLLDLCYCLSNIQGFSELSTTSPFSALKPVTYLGFHKGGIQHTPPSPPSPPLPASSLPPLPCPYPPPIPGLPSPSLPSPPLEVGPLKSS